MIGDGGVEIPDVPEPITGYRTWGYSGDDRLRSIQSQLTWQPGQPLHAECLDLGANIYWFGSTKLPEPQPLTEHTAPCPPADKQGHLGEGCGIYAWKTLGALLEKGRPSPWLPVGEILLWGRVYEHEHGFRAEWAEVSCLYVLPGSTAGQAEDAARVAEVYGVPCVRFPMSDEEYLRRQFLSRPNWAQQVAAAAATQQLASTAPRSVPPTSSATPAPPAPQGRASHPLVQVIRDVWRRFGCG